MITLYATPLSAHGRKVMALAHHLGLDARIELVDVYRGEGQRPEYLAINPSGRIPTLVEDEFVLSESNAILQYLADAHGGEALLPREPRARATIASWLFWEATAWGQALLPVLRDFVSARLVGGREADAPPADWQHEGLRPQLARLEARLVERPYLALDSLSIADLSVAGMMTYFESAAFPFGAWPAIAAWYERIESLEAWRATEAPLWKAP